MILQQNLTKSQSIDNNPLIIINIMKKSKKHSSVSPSSNPPNKKPLNSRLKLPISAYSQKYHRYMIQEYPYIDLMIKKIIQLPCCRPYYLKFPLEGLLRGVVKKLMINGYQLGVYGYFLEQVESWGVGSEIYGSLYEVFPDIIHVNQPTSQQQLKELSMFLYFSSYSVKQFLNTDMQMYRHQMQKLFPEFQHLHTHWVNSQPTVNLALNPRTLNQYFKKMSKIEDLIDYNTCVDKIIQISPCYDLSGRGEKVIGGGGKSRDFGYMHTGSKDYLPFNSLILGQGEVKMETQQIDLMDDDFKYDGRGI